MSCPDPLLIHAYADGELDAASSVGIERHLVECGACSALRADIAATSAQLRTATTYHCLAPSRRAAMLNEIAQSLPIAPAPLADSPRFFKATRQFWRGAVSGAIAATLVATVLLLSIPRTNDDALLRDLVGAHVRSLLPNRLVDVASTDHHTVKPWFAGHADVSPPVVDFEAQGYRMVGGRVDYVEDRRAAVVVYRHGAHVINVFVWPDPSVPLPARIRTRNGYQVACWRADSLALCAISDTAAEVLVELTHLLQATTNPKARE